LKKIDLTIIRLCCILTLGIVLQSRGAAQELCSTVSLGVQVLGSGGPFAGTNRASSGYLVWREGRAVVMVDAGGGTYVRFGEAGARLNDLSLLAISHLHPDHVADLPALMWLSDQVRNRPLVLSGPLAGGRFPDIEAFVNRLFDSTTGAFSILGGAVGQTGVGVQLNVEIVDVEAADVTTVLAEEDIFVTATGVPHGTSIPSVAYRVHIGEQSIVFSSDQNGTDERFVNFAMGADVLVMHLAIATQATDGLRQLHATPEIVGEIARDSAVERLVLSHVSDTPAGVPTREFFSIPRLDENVAVVKEIFGGPVIVSEDLQCIVLEQGVSE